MCSVIVVGESVFLFVFFRMFLLKVLKFMLGGGVSFNRLLVFDFVNNEINFWVNV